MKTKVLSRILPLALLSATATIFTTLTAPAGKTAPNTLSADEKAAGWKLLFDGNTAASWRSFGKPTFPESGWKVHNGWLVKKGGQKPGNLVSRNTYTDYEFSWEWRMTQGGNNGVKYFVDEERGNLGHEYQMLSNPGGKINKSATAGFYAVLAPRDLPPINVAPASNHSRIRVQGSEVKHWLNGKLVLEYTLGSPEVLANVATSKFKNVSAFGKKLTGRLMLTDHGSECAFRNLKIRRLPASGKGD